MLSSTTNVPAWAMSSRSHEVVAVLLQCSWSNSISRNGMAEGGKAGANANGGFIMTLRFFMLCGWLAQFPSPKAFRALVWAGAR
jgi:hypothetical protein